MTTWGCGTPYPPDSNLHYITSWAHLSYHTHIHTHAHTPHATCRTLQNKVIPAHLAGVHLRRGVLQGPSTTSTQGAKYNFRTTVWRAVPITCTLTNTHNDWNNANP